MITAAVLTSSCKSKQMRRHLLETQVLMQLREKQASKLVPWCSSAERGVRESGVHLKLRLTLTATHSSSNSST